MLILSACETSGRIEPSSSMLDLRLASGEWPSITRDQTNETYRRLEEWDWPNGSLYITRARRGRYYDNDFADAEDMIDDVGHWSASGGARVDRRDVHRDSNAIGEFQYVVLNRGSRNCFFMLQPIPHTVGPNRLAPGSAEYANGYISFYHCEAVAASSAEKLETLGLKFSRALARSW